MKGAIDRRVFPCFIGDWVFSGLKRVKRPESYLRVPDESSRVVVALVVLIFQDMD